MDFKILTVKLLDDDRKAVKESPLDKIDNINRIELSVDYFQFYKSVSSVYSSTDILVKSPRFGGIIDYYLHQLHPYFVIC